MPGDSQLFIIVLLNAWGNKPIMAQTDVPDQNRPFRLFRNHPTADVYTRGMWQTVSSEAVLSKTLWKLQYSATKNQCKG
jgi:hypothetical protein